MVSGLRVDWNRAARREAMNGTDEARNIEWQGRPVSELPAEEGAYVLEFANPDRQPIEVGALGEVVLPSGRLRYYGSAKGPGGLRARVRRHLRDDGKVHWHVDYLAEALEVRRVGYTTAFGECELVAMDEGSGEWSVVVEGFGASDCETCEAHLLVGGR